MVFKSIFGGVLLILSRLVKYVKKFFLVWCILETYTLIFLVFLFSFRGKGINKSALIYFGIINLFVSVLLIFRVLRDFSLLGIIRVLGKVGVFPIMEWVILFLKNLKWFRGWLFFSVNKLIPFYLLSEFLNPGLKFLILFFFLKTFYSLCGAIRRVSFTGLIRWSSVGRTGFFLFLITFRDKVIQWERLLLLYSAILFTLFLRLSSLKLKEFLIRAILFGFPPVSLFLFKAYLFLIFVERFGLFWRYFFLSIITGFGVAYFLIYARERQNFILISWKSLFGLQARYLILGGALIMFLGVFIFL